jgi:hypothetical protein
VAAVEETVEGERSGIGLRQVLLSPKWWLFHFFVLVAVLVMLRLGLWQWHRSQSESGGIQNYAYAFQWPCFAVFAIVLWVKTIRLEMVGQDDSPNPASRFNAKPLPEPAIKKGPGVRIGIMTTPEHIDEDDSEMAAYNAYLTRLNKRAAGVPTSASRQAG